MRALLESLDVPVLDLAPALREAEWQSPTYHLRGAHWNRRGNEAAARAVTEWLATQLPSQAMPQGAGG